MRWFPCQWGTVRGGGKPGLGWNRLLSARPGSSLWEADVSLDDTSSLFKDVPPELLPTTCICLPLARNESHGSTYLAGRLGGVVQLGRHMFGSYVGDAVSMRRKGSAYGRSITYCRVQHERGQHR